MKYLAERSLFYYFLMKEIKDVGSDAWLHIANMFGVNHDVITHYEGLVSDPVLDDLLTTDDIDMYKNFINMDGFLNNKRCFGKSESECDVIEAKALALQKAKQLFGETGVKADRLRILSLIYEKDHIASVLYAVQLFCADANKDVLQYANDILTKEFREGQNSDAGFILLGFETTASAEIAMYLKGFPDMLLRPDVIRYLSDKYGDGSYITLKTKRAIGF